MIVTIEEDPETGELFLPLPEEILNILGVEIGDTLVWEIEEDGTTSIKKKEP